MWVCVCGHNVSYTERSILRLCQWKGSRYKYSYYLMVKSHYCGLYITLQEPDDESIFHVTTLNPCLCSHHGSLAESTPDSSRRFATPPHILISRTPSASSPSLQRRISTNAPRTIDLKNKGRRFNVQLKKGKRVAKRGQCCRSENQQNHVCNLCVLTSYGDMSPPCLICFLDIFVLLSEICVIIVCFKASSGKNSWGRLNSGLTLLLTMGKF